MTEHNLIKKEDAICLLEDDECAFLIESNGKYMTAARMIDLSVKMFATAEKYGDAIDTYNRKMSGEEE